MSPQWDGPHCPSTPTRQEYPATDCENLCLVNPGKCGILIAIDMYMQHTPPITATVTQRHRDISANKL